MRGVAAVILVLCCVCVGGCAGGRLAHRQGSLVGGGRAGFRPIRRRHRRQQLQFVRKLPARPGQSLPRDRQAVPRHRRRLRQMAVSAAGLLRLEERPAVFLRRCGERVGRRSALHQDGQPRGCRGATSSTAATASTGRTRSREVIGTVFSGTYRTDASEHKRRAVGFLFAGAAAGLDPPRHGDLRHQRPCRHRLEGRWRRAHLSTWTPIPISPSPAASMARSSARARCGWAAA